MNLVSIYKRRFIVGLHVGHAVRVLKVPDKTPSRVWPEPERVIHEGLNYEIAEIIKCTAHLECRKTCTTGCTAFMLKTFMPDGTPVVSNSCNHILATTDGKQIRF